MFKNHYTARIGFIRTLDRVCPTHGGRYSSNETANCPKCGVALVQFTVQTQQGVRPQCLTELVIYPVMRPADEKQWEERTAKAGGLKYQIRVSLWGRYDAERQVAYPDKRVQYMQPKRLIRIELNTKPIFRPYTSQKENGAQMIEVKYEFNHNRGDQIEFLDPKQASDELMTNAHAVTSPQQQPINNAPAAQPAATGDAAKLDSMMQEIVALRAKLSGNPTPAPAAPQDAELMKAAAQSPPDELDPTEDGMGSIGDAFVEGDIFPVA